MSIVYPKFFEDILRTDINLHAATNGTIADFTAWIGDSKLPFFTDYTDHGINHLNQILMTADNLIAKDARQFFTPGDVAILTLAVLLHDCAMHLSEDGFRELILGRSSAWSIDGFKDKPWAKLWEEFLFSAKRWDDRKLCQIFGEIEPGVPRSKVKDPFDNYHNLSDSDRKLIGEFIRLHHPRLAHEFATYGVPGPSLNLIRPDSRFGNDLCDIAGLVARSHGMPVRACLEYLEKKGYHRRDYRGIHAVFLMVLLRVADYLQIQADRAPAITFRYKHIPSKNSMVEWNAHRAIVNITQTHDDPESIEIQAKPGDVKTFIRLKEWLFGIQTELDASWAVLGEVYGSQVHSGLHKLGLILRRVRSNLDEVGAFAQTVDYVPERIELSVARPDLLRLLVRPLYDNIPEIGIRELMQNALDAVRERWVLEKKDPSLKHVELLAQDNDVEIWLDSPNENGSAWLTISDRGIGMSIEVIRDYFLTAGASFRNSDAWKKEFEVEGQPKSRVLRSGRFGVGVLAGFLLGAKMEISTRHIRDNTGIRFQVTLEPDIIELKYDNTLPVGTTIKILISPSDYKTLNNGTERVSVPNYFDWFCYSSPKVARFKDSQRDEKPPEYNIAPEDFYRPSGWRRLRNMQNYEVYWSYEKAPSLSVNGIFVTNSSTRSKFSTRSNRSRRYLHETGLEITHPNICIQDYDGSFPINLRRSNITEQHYPFEQQLVNDIVDDFLAYLIVKCPYENNSSWTSLRLNPGLTFIADQYCTIFKYSYHYIFSTKVGIAPMLVSLYKTVFPNSLLILPPKINSSLYSASRGHDATLHLKKIESSNSIYNKGSSLPYISEPEKELLKALDLLTFLTNFAKTTPYSGNQFELPGIKSIIGGRIIIPTRLAKFIKTSDEWLTRIQDKYNTEKQEYQNSAKSRSRNQLPGYLSGEPREPDKEIIVEMLSLIVIEEVLCDYTMVATINCPPTLFDTEIIKKMKKNSDSDDYIFEIFVNQSTGNNDMFNTKMGDRWETIIHSPEIPFNIAERQSRLSKAYTELHYFIEIYRALERG